VPSSAGGAALAGQSGTLVADLFPEGGGQLAATADLQARFDPPFVPVWAWATTIGGLGAGALVGVGSLVGFTGAAPDDPTRAVWGAGVVVGAVVAAAGLAGAIVEIPFVDWEGLQAENAALLEERAARIPTPADSSAPPG
jgi:hypothetical protein